MKPNQCRLWIIALTAMLFVAGCGHSSFVDKNSVPTVPIGQFAHCPMSNGSLPADNGLPDLTLGCLDGSGGRYKLAQGTGKPMVINLWASWCPPCGKELPAFVRLAIDAGDQLTVLGVITEDDIAAAVSAARDSNISFANLFDPKGELRRKLGRNSLPITLFVDTTGELRHIYNGPPLTDETLRSLVAEHLHLTL